MATYSVVKSTHQTLTGTTADTVNLLQFWDSVEISNRGTVPIYVVWGAGVTAPTSGVAGSDVVEAGITKLFPRSINGLVGNDMGNANYGTGTSSPHVLQLVGNGNGYSVIGVQGQ